MERRYIDSFNDIKEPIREYDRICDRLRYFRMESETCGNIGAGGIKVKVAKSRETSSLLKLTVALSKLISGIIAASMILAPCGEVIAFGQTEEETKPYTEATSEVLTLEEGDVPKVVNIGVQTLLTPELIARYEKIYEDYLGTSVNLVQFDSGASVNTAFVSGDLDIGAMGSAPASIGIASGLGYQVFWYLDVIGEAESLVATQDSGISSLDDLVGKKVATPFASTSHFVLLSALSNAGVKVSDIDLLDMQPDDIYAAWKRKDIDAAYVWNPVLGELIADGGVVITDSATQAEENGIITADVGEVRTAFGEEYPNVVSNYIKAQIYALNVFYNDNQTGISEIAAAAGISDEDAAEQVKGFYYPTATEQISDSYLGTEDQTGSLAQTLKDTADFLVEQGSIDSAPDLSVFEEGVTGKYVQRALGQ